MARHQYAVLSSAAPGREDEFIAWYRDTHLADVCHMPGVVSGRLIKLGFQRVYDLDAPPYTLLTLYELEGDDPEAIIAAIRNASGSATMPSTDALTKIGMIQVIGEEIARLHNPGT